MFNSNKSSKILEEPRVDRIDTIIGENAVIEGLIKTKDRTRVDGRIKGDSFFEGHLVVGENGHLEGNVTAQSVLVAGEIKGNITAKNKLEISESGKIYGDITAKVLYIEEGAVFEGKCNMITEKKSVPPNSIPKAEAHKESKA